MFINVDLPSPFAPTRPMCSPFKSRKDTSWKMARSPKPDVYKRQPIISVNGEFAAVADQQGTSIYICDKSGNQGKATSLLPIMRVAVSAKGVVAALSEDSKASYINMFLSLIHI